MEHTTHQTNSTQDAQLWLNRSGQCMFCAIHVPSERRSSSSRQVPEIFFLRTSETALIKLRSFAGLLLLIIALVVPSVAQPASTSRPQNSDSLGDSLRHPQGREIHIFYIHGIGSAGPDDNDSLPLRKSICDYLKDCTSVAGVPIGEWDYADQDQFRLDAHSAKNSTRWFWIIENPNKAHNNYASDKRAIREILRSHAENKQ